MPNGLPRKLIEVTPTVTASSAYSSGNCVGGIQSFLNANENELWTSLLESVVILDPSNQSVNYSLLFFKSDPTLAPNGATVTDKTGFAWGTGGGKGAFLGKYDVASTGFESFNSVAVFSTGGINLVMRPLLRTLFMAIVTTGTPTYSSTVGPTFKIGLQMT